MRNALAISTMAVLVATIVSPGRTEERQSSKAQAKKRPELFVPLLARVLPLQMTGADSRPIRLITASMSVEEASRLYRETIGQINRIDR